MAKYTLSDNERRDGWYSRDYSYRYPNRAGEPCVEEELQQRLDAGQPTFLWRFDVYGQEPVRMPIAPRPRNRAR